MGQLDGEVALVSAGSQGIGQATAQASRPRVPGS
jgi:NAD(P)-dependent dehydrogenase (short-subunit alcohol dehydrogenase family)